jgi:hypothetical protein
MLQVANQLLLVQHTLPQLSKYLLANLLAKQKNFSLTIVLNISSEAKVNLGNENGEMVTITGLDDMGFLSVINGLNEVQSVQPDGNSFDMMRNLITIKTRK